MSVKSELDARVRRWDVVDVKLSQIAAFFLALVVAKLIPEVLSVSVWWFAALAVICGAKPTLDFFRSQQSTPVARAKS